MHMQLVFDYSCLSRLLLMNLLEQQQQQCIHPSSNPEYQTDPLVVNAEWTDDSMKAQLLSEPTVEMPVLDKAGTRSQALTLEEYSPLTQHEQYYQQVQQVLASVPGYLSLQQSVVGDGVDGAGTNPNSQQGISAQESGSELSILNSCE